MQGFEGERYGAVIEILIPVGGLLVFGLVGAAIVAAGRRQRQAKRDVFRTFANMLGLYHVAPDDGTAQRFAADFDGIGQFNSPSLGTVIPEEVVSGTFEGREVVAFRHSTRFYEGNAREWYVIGVVASEEIADRSAVQFLKSRASKSSLYLRDSVVAEHETPTLRLVVRAPTPQAAGALINEDVLGHFAELAQDLPFRPEIQVRMERIAVYPAGRNYSINDAEEWINLLRFAMRVATTPRDQA